MIHKFNASNKTCTSYSSNRSYFVLFVFLFIFFILPAKPASAATLSRPPTNLGLVGYWPMDEGSGSITRNMSINGSNGNLNSATWANGKYGKSLYFNGATSVNTNYDLSWNNTSLASISFWLKPDNITDYQTGIMGKQYGNWEWGFYQENAAVNLVYWDTSGGHTNGMDSGWGNVLEAGKWINLSYTWDGSTSRFYKNGVLVNTFVATNPSLNQNRTNSVMIGGNIYIWGDRYFRGNIDDVRAYSRALSATEISRLYSSGQVTRKQVANTGLVGYWSLNDGAGNRAVDSSGNNNNGTITGANWTNGKRGKALSFDSIANNYANISNSSILNFGSGDLTVSGWAKTPFTENAAGLVYKGNNVFNLDGVGWEVRSRNSGSTRFEFCLNAGTGTCSRIWNTNAGNLEPNKWYFFAFTYVRSTGEVIAYINNFTPTTGTNVTSIYTDSYPLQFGTGENGTINGQIDDVRVYNRALSVTEIQALYKQNETVVNASQAGKITNGLVGYWPFNGLDIATTTSYDRSGQGNNGSIIGATVTQGKSGQALSFNGSSDYVQIPNHTSLNPNTFTISAWAKSNVPVWNDYGFIVSKRDAYIIHPNQNSKSVNFYIYTNSWVATSCTPNTITEWGLYTMTWDGTSIKCFINGVQGGVNAPGGSVNTADTGVIQIGRDDGLARYFNGAIDEVRIYNRALSTDEIKQLYNMGK